MIKSEPTERSNRPCTFCKMTIKKKLYQTYLAAPRWRSIRRGPPSASAFPSAICLYSSCSGQIKRRRSISFIRSQLLIHALISRSRFMTGPPDFSALFLSHPQILNSHPILKAITLTLIFTFSKIILVLISKSFHV